MATEQISYDNVCLIAGKLFLESIYETGRLTAMLLELQKKYSELNQEKLKLETELKTVNQRMSYVREGKWNRVKKNACR